jgi:hypothetical protein
MTNYMPRSRVVAWGLVEVPASEKGQSLRFRPLVLASNAGTPEIDLTDIAKSGKIFKF